MLFSTISRIMYVFVFSHSPTPDISQAGISNWSRRHPVADGDSITLYEHKAGSNNHHGDPIADVYSVVLHTNSCVLAVADGVNWGIKPRLAARCAVHGAMDHLNRCLYTQATTPPKTTQDIFHCILRSFDSAQRLIIERGGTTTTLCVGVIVELAQEQRGACRWGLCVVSVGDSLCYVWREDAQMAYEVTSAIHAGKERNPRDCGGCLGCNLGDQPDLSNLVCSYVPLSEEDIVFIVSDGVSDNLDPVILREGMSESTPTSPTHAVEPTKQPHPFPGSQDVTTKDQAAAAPSSEISNGSNRMLPVLSPEQRQTLGLMKLTGILKEKLKSCEKLDAQKVNDAIVGYVIEATEMKRGYLEKCWQECDRADLTAAERRANDRKISVHLKSLPGKLDHATIASYQVGKILVGEASSNASRSKSPTHSHVMKKTELHLRKKSHSQGGSVFYGGAVNGGVVAGSSSSPRGGENKKKKMGNRNRRDKVEMLNKSRSLDTDLLNNSAEGKDGHSAEGSLKRVPLERAATVSDTLEEPEPAATETPGNLATREEEELTTGGVGSGSNQADSSDQFPSDDAHTCNT